MVVMQSVFDTDSASRGPWIHVADVAVRPIPLAPNNAWVRPVFRGEQIVSRLVDPHEQVNVLDAVPLARIGRGSPLDPKRRHDLSQLVSKCAAHGELLHGRIGLIIVQSSETSDTYPTLTLHRVSAPELGDGTSRSQLDGAAHGRSGMVAGRVERHTVS